MPRFAMEGRGAPGVKLNIRGLSHQIDAREWAATRPCSWPAPGLLSNIYPIKMGDSVEFVRAMHIVEVDLRPYNAGKGKGRA